ncbi:hypothetical protein DPMN_018063 [Dreissena polymorpha]|uniref:Uncharacterized protein n=1 Tax=Dreissena polymorpha TaxID=45954 RepID=A0A9D4S6Y9_DREPO|nr:hypothetical protein DPMN_018063 [Dreissena polymorpha]
MPNGNIIIADDSNKKVKMLDKNYRVICQCVLSSSPVSVCKISDDSLAAAVYDWTNFHEINFLAVTSDENLVKTSAFTLNHPCTGVCHNMGLLYITSRTALYRYTLTGTLVDKMYEDTSNFNTVFRCALNTREDKIYVLNWAQQQVLTLNMFGQVLTSFTDPELETPYDVHVSESGHVLIAGYSSKIIIQLNSKGTKKIDHVVSLKEGNNILYVCVLKRTGSILVGSYGTDEILVFNTK